MSKSKEGEVVCVTGASGAIGSWVVRLLLDRGYTVHATFKDTKDKKEMKHLEALEGAETRLHFYQIQVLDYDSIAAAIDGCSGVFHLASPCILDTVQDPQKEILDPAIKGTINVLTAAKEKGVRRVVVTSSVCGMVPQPNWPANVSYAEDVWTDIEFSKKNGLWYTVSKTLAEKAAWDFSKEKGLDVVVVNPCGVFGPVIPPTLNCSMLMLLRLLQGSTEIYKDVFLGPVHFKDVALAHITVYENPSATGRHLCVETICDFSDFAAKVAELYPEYNVPRLPKDTESVELLKTTNGAKKLKDLGIEFIPQEQIIKDAVESLKSKGFIS